MHANTQETRVDDGFPDDLRPLLDDSTIGMKGLAAPTTVATGRKTTSLEKADDNVLGTGSSGALFLDRRPSKRRFHILTSLLLLGLTSVLIFQIGPLAQREMRSHDESTPGLPAIVWKKITEGLSLFNTSVSPYDPVIYPWAGEPHEFMKTLKKSQAAVSAARQALWNARQPHSEAIVPHVKVWNEEHLIKKFNRVLLEQKPFVIGVMGASVPAGRDTRLNESFSVVWKELMHDIFTMAGVPLVLRSDGMGWTPFQPSYFCVEEMVGPNVDMAVWGFETTEENDGHLEQFIRSSLLLPSQPHILLCSPLGGEALGARTNPAFAPWVVPGTEPYRDSGFSFASHNLTHSFMSLNHLPEYQSQRLHVTGEAADPAGRSSSQGGHRLRAEILAWTYLGFFESALEEVHAFIAANEGDLSPLLPELLPLPPPIHCPPALCEKKCQCATTFQPRIGNGLRDHLVHPRDVPVVTNTGETVADAIKTWHEQTYTSDLAAPDTELVKDMNYLDGKYVFQAGESAGPISFQFTSSMQNHVVACSAPKSASLCSGGAVWKVDGQNIGCLDHEAAVAAGLPPVKSPCWITNKKIPAGKHSFEVERPVDSNGDKGKFSAVAKKSYVREKRVPSFPLCSVT